MKESLAEICFNAKKIKLHTVVDLFDRKIKVKVMSRFIDITVH